MRTSPIYDPGFVNCSPELKKLFGEGHLISGDCCVDVPCGIGRNSFFLASRFRRVLAADINDSYLKSLEDSQDAYGDLHGTITTQQLDLERHMPEQIGEADLVVTIHYYSYAFMTKVIQFLKPGAFFYLETPSCAGGNYLELPTIKEFEVLISNTKVLYVRNNPCGSPGRQFKSASVKCLIKKPNA